jgi:hypothetical protein
MDFDDAVTVAVSNFDSKGERRLSTFSKLTFFN